ncbi:MAG: hypothetical protein ACRD15_10100 [Vicinamibacterales bacterium]
MNRLLKTCALALPLIALSAGPAIADVKTRDKTQVKLEGFLGRMMGMFGGKAAKDGIVTTTAVKGDRKVELNESTGRIVDLKEEKVYELDVKKKSYEVTTFEELRRRMREAREKAERETPKEQQPQQQEPGKPAREVEVDFDVKETGQTKTLAGHNTREVVMTVTVREKGRTLEEGGGMVMTSNSWMAPAIPAMKELAEFEMRYWKAIAPEAAGLSAEQMAALTAMDPMLKDAMERLKTEGAKLEGTPLATTTVFEAVKTKEQMAEQGQQSGGGGLGGMLARRMMKKGDDKPRSTVFTINHETLEVTPSVAATDLEIPAGFKEKK